MEIPPLAHTTHLLISRISVHQDFFWFFSLLAWSFVLLVWWRHPARRTALGWLPWAAATVIATALFQFGMFNPTFDLFIERLVPGTISVYKPALVDPYWLGDMLIAGAEAVMIAGWAWSGLGATRWRYLCGLLIPAGLVLLLVHWVNPGAGGATLAVLALLGAAGQWRQTAGSPGARAGLLGAALVPALSSVGPVAVRLNALERLGPPTPFGLGVACFQLLLGVMMLAALLHSLWPRLTAASHAGFRRDAVRFGPGAVVLLLAGLFLGIQNGRDNRNEIQQNRLRTAAAQALVFNPALLEPLAEASFHIPPGAPADRVTVVQSAWLARGALERARRQLAKVVVSTPFEVEARILVVRDGWLAAVLSSHGPAGPVTLLRRATPADMARWATPTPHVEESPVPEIGFNYYCRAPIVDGAGRMLGWLDCVRREYYLSIERRWRVAPFTLTALGLVLLGLVLVQRQGARERETALRQAAVETEANRMKSTFLASVSHELRTPLQSLLGYSELLRPGLADPDQRAWLDALRQQGDLMTRLVNDLIDLSAVDAGSFQLAPQSAAPAAVVRETVETLRPRAAAKGLRLDLEVGPGVPGWISVDTARLRQVVLNLAGNALKFTDHGAVTVALHAAPAAAGTVTLTLAVRDTGPGIPPAEQRRLFTPFSRLAATAAKEGSGLGLALSAALCRAMGGGITVTSDGNSGSTFTATLQAPLTAAPAAAPAPRTAAGATAPRVLVVDDNRLVRELFVAALTRRGAVCRAAADGATALAACAAENPEAIVLDLALPDGDGTDLVPRLRALAPGVRIVGVSAHAGVADRTRALAAGMDAFLVKPVPLDALWSAVAGAVPAATGSVAHFDTPAELREKLWTEFRRELPAKRAELAAAVATENWSRVRAIAHYLRNSALVVQADELFAACTGLEAAATGPADGLPAWWHRCRTALDALAS